MTTPAINSKTFTSLSLSKGSALVLMQTAEEKALSAGLVKFGKQGQKEFGEQLSTSSAYYADLIKRGKRTGFDYDEVFGTAILETLDVFEKWENEN